MTSSDWDVQTLITKLGDPDPGERRRAVEELGRHGRTLSDPATVVCRLARMLPWEETPTRYEVVRALEAIRHPHAARPLAAALVSDEEPLIRSASARALAAIGGGFARNALLLALGNEQDDGVRATVRMACRAVSQ